MIAIYMASKQLIVPLIPFLFGIISVSATGQCLSNEFLKLTASDADDGDQYGDDVAMSDNVAVIGSSIFDPDGSVYVYRVDTSNGTWLQEDLLSGSDTVTGDAYGASVAIAGDIIVVGAPRDDDNGGDSGSAYVYRFKGGEWVEEQKLTPINAATNDWFGSSVSIDGESIAVGAPQRYPLGYRPGAAYVFTYDSKTSTWFEEAELTATDGTGGDEFGRRVSISGNTMIAGVHEDDDDGTGSGSVYIFRRKGVNWVEEQKLTASDGGYGDSFGIDVALRENIALIGSSGDNENGSNSGAGYLFRFNVDSGTWIEEQKLLAHDGAVSDQLGRSVSLRDQVALLGASADDDGGNSSGSAYLYQFNGLEWIEEAKLIASDDDPLDHFGRGVAVGNGFVVVGAYHDDAAGSQAGAAYIFSGIGDCNNNGELDLCDFADGESQDGNDNGIPDECECPWDLDNSGSVGTSDLLELFAQWGTDGSADFDESGAVGTSDLLILFANWGPCP